MSFWNNQPGPTFKHYLKSLWQGPKEPELLEGPAEVPQTRWNIRRAGLADVPQICKFWKEHFRRPNSPVTLYDSELLTEQLSEGGHILLVCHSSDQDRILGTIMSQPLGPIKRIGVGNWSSFQIRWIDMFCVHHSKWKQGLGSALLNTLYQEHQAVGDHACIFMKEGSGLPMPALRSSEFVFRYVLPAMAAEKNKSVEEWTSDQFLTFVQTLPSKTNYFIHQRPGNLSRIFAYNGFNGTIAAVFTEGHEVHYEDEKPIIWCSGIVRSGQLMDAEEVRAATYLSNAASGAFNSPWVWMDGRQLKMGTEWIKDGPYHIYAFHMDTGIYMKAEPLLIL